MSSDPLNLIGPYRIVELLGEGGMGTVYRARQVEPVRRDIALKVLKPGVDSAEVLERFDAERQALAVMDHPSIAKVFDAGVADDGRPYFAMELVTGPSLVAYCDERRLPVKERLALFIRLCAAVQHAHQKGLIHRDLKPSNILVSEVDGEPLPRIIDFGIAKAYGGNEFDGTGLTRDDQVIGTPAYMSPEQLEGSRDIDTRSDLYALGVVLYELVTGTLPFEPSAYRGWAAVAATLHREPPSPSRRFAEIEDMQQAVAANRSTTVAALSRELRGDLGWIVTRAMDRNRDRRYETANAMALDLERLLDHEPIRARGAGTAYVVGKFVRRNRLAVAFGATTALGLVAFSIVTAIQADRVARARDEAESRRDQAEGLIAFMLSDLRDKLEPIGRLEILDDVGAQATAYFSLIPEDQFTDDELASWSQALYQIGAVRLEQGSSESAVTAFAESLRLAAELSARAPSDVDRLFGLSQSHFYVGYAAWLAGDLASAENEFLSYQSVAGRLVAIAPDNLDYRVEVGYAHSNLGSVREARGDLAGAAEAFALSLRVERERYVSDSTNVDYIGELAETHNKLGVVLRKSGDYPGALEHHTEELRLKRKILDLEPGHAYWRFRTATAMAFLAHLARVTGDDERAAELYASHVSTLDALLEMDPANTRWQRSKAEVLRLAAVVDTRRGMYERATRLLDEAERIMTHLVETDSTAFGWRTDLSATFTARSELDLSRGDLGTALTQASRAVELLGRDRPVGADGAEVAAEARLMRGRALHALGNEGEARREWERALQTVEAFGAGADEVQFRPLRAEALLLLERSEEARAQIEALGSIGHVDERLTRLAESLPGS